ncbi:hypothetical protein TNCV_2693021 [Trichonephila clavipes]|uniref:Uncharacterized protein n=1 Tax=Trichonephila clavipes TaxID=2585209 RepID=A0A8X7BAI6_TRICX|nr:hypothetical protein TNCV_2693021 [Trichonephila clavipes]
MRTSSRNSKCGSLSRNPVESITGEKVNCAVNRDVVLSSREQLIEEQRKYPELGQICRYLENPEDRSVNVTICENWSRNFHLIEGLLFYAKYATSQGEMRLYFPKSLRNEIMREFHHKPIADHGSASASSLISTPLAHADTPEGHGGSRYKCPTLITHCQKQNKKLRAVINSSRQGIDIVTLKEECHITIELIGIGTYEDVKVSRGLPKTDKHGKGVYEAKFWESLC